jgi:predicted dehydrogenase
VTHPSGTSAIIPLPLTLFGTGRWGTHLLRNFLAHPQIQLKAVVDPSLAQLQLMAEKFDLGEDVQLLSDGQMALAQMKPGEAVAIATPAHTHEALIRSALAQKLHVLAEKPLTLTAESATALCQFAEAQACQLVVDHTYLFHPGVAAGAQVMCSGKLGTLRYGYATRTHIGPVRPDVDALWDLAIHDIAIFNHWLGETPMQVQAQGMTWLQTTVEQPPLFPQGLADVVWCRLVYPSGFQATIHLCWANPDKQRRLCVVGDAGTLIFDELHAIQPLQLQTGALAPQGSYYHPQGLTTVPIAMAATEPLRQLCDHFVACVAQHQPSEVSSGWVGAELVRVLEALSASLNAQGQWIVL